MKIILTMGRSALCISTFLMALFLKVDIAESKTDFTLNNKSYEIAIAPNLTLADMIRYEIGITGTKKGCDTGDCGACRQAGGSTRLHHAIASAIRHGIGRAWILFVGWSTSTSKRCTRVICQPNSLTCR